MHGSNLENSHQYSPTREHLSLVLNGIISSPTVHGLCENIVGEYCETNVRDHTEGQGI